MSTTQGNTSGAEERALRWLLSFSDPALGVGWNPRASRSARWRLGRMRALLDVLGAPDGDMRIVLIAGTKGKGSTAAMLASVLHASGVRAGLFTSPHLQMFRERVRIDGAMPSTHRFASATDELRSAVARLRRRAPEAGAPTTFELVLALALSEFARARCVVGVVEVGLGGAFDATNATEPAVSVVTSISYDHTAILGGSLVSIAHEKAGILRAGRPALLARQRPSVGRALRAACRHAHAECRVIGPLGPPWRVGLAGAHQRQNAALALAAATALQANGVAVSRAAYARGLRDVVWPGRFEVAQRRPPIVLDGAHNRASAEALARELRRQFGVARLVLVFGIQRDKDARAVLRPLVPLAGAIVATAAPSPRALPAVELAAPCRAMAHVPVAVEPEVSRALSSARALAGDGVVCVTGSLALVGACRDALGLRPRERWW